MLGQVYFYSHMLTFFSAFRGQSLLFARLWWFIKKINK